jgi:aminopeptidase N
VRYFHSLFGKYPYESYGAAFHPFGFGQGFPSMVMIPGTDRANKYTYAFIAHETAHQWWGNIVAWRSYRDQWLSEGFAEYSGILYTSLRKDYKASINLIDELRDSLQRPPETRTGIGKGKLVDVGPLILGHRLETSKSYGAYSALIYNKGALVLRMLHFLFTDPQTGNGDPFFAMMKDFVERHRNGVASTEDFIAVANAHFAKTPLAQRYGLKDLNWFFRQWVYESAHPSYTLEYSLQDQPDGSCVVQGTVTQENVPETWAMILPVNFSLGDDRVARTTVAAVGPKSTFNMKLSRRPQKVELDPQKWVLSEKTTEKAAK